MIKIMLKNIIYRSKAEKYSEVRYKYRGMVFTHIIGPYFIQFITTGKTTKSCFIKILKFCLIIKIEMLLGFVFCYDILFMIIINYLFQNTRT